MNDFEPITKTQEEAIDMFNLLFPVGSRVVLFNRYGGREELTVQSKAYKKAQYVFCHFKEKTERVVMNRMSYREPVKAVSC
ncbi:MAG: hypothetical protein WCO63_01220 [Bacteroidota bacterium]